MVPETVDGLLVPVAASTTHVAFSTVRLEPTWMALGQAAGVAAHLAIAGGVEPRAVNVEQLQRETLRRGQVITYFKDIDSKDPAYAALQYFGTKGFFPDYLARSKDAVDGETAARWWRIATGKAAPGLEGAFTRGVLARWLGTGEPARAGEAVTRGEMCQALYERR